MEDQVAISVDNLSKTFKLPNEKSSSLKNAVVNFYKRDAGYEQQLALDNITFKIKKGEFFGIIGRNGSGKSTLLKLLAGIYSPSKGSVFVDGKLTPFIELGVGFSPELSGRENVYLNGSLLGFNRKEMDEMYEDIVDFAEIRRFMDQKLKNYSSGMQVRLAFSIAIRAKSDILLLDEVLAVGDADFQRKCLRYFAFLKKNKKTVILVSHDMASIRKFCDRVILIENGEIKNEGSPDDVITEFLSGFVEHNSGKKTNQKELPLGMSSAVSIDDSSVNIDEFWLENLEGNHIDELEEGLQNFFVCFTAEALKDVESIVPGVIITNELDEFVVAANSKWDNQRVSNSVKKGNKYLIKFKFQNIFEQGDYKISINIVSEDLETFFTWKNNIGTMFVEKPFITGGKVNPRTEIAVTKI